MSQAKWPRQGEKWGVANTLWGRWAGYLKVEEHIGSEGGLVVEWWSISHIFERCGLFIQGKVAVIKTRVFIEGWSISHIVVRGGLVIRG